MSELINNREYRQKVLKELIKDLHDGKDPEEVKKRFAEVFEGVAASEISDLEQSLVAEGMPITEIQRLCDVHASLFKGSIEEIHHPEHVPGHPLHTFEIENKELEKLINNEIKPAIDSLKDKDSKENLNKLTENFNLLWDIDKHYKKKENLLFPYLEKYGITAPPKVMWGVDDEIRDAIKKTKNALINYKGNKDELVGLAEEAVNKASEMIFKERNILFPMSIDTLSQDEWVKIERESDEIGYCLASPQAQWRPKREDVEDKEEGSAVSKGFVRFDTGILTPKEISLLLNTLPLDITFIDKDDVVKYFSQGKERIFSRTKAVIGRTVQNCHPPASVHIVEKMLEDFKSGKKDSEDFWINMGGMYVYIRYFAVRDEKGEYIGTLEVTQNIKSIQEIKGEKRLVED
ncbi:MAG: DUF438 domain-containing protein [Bacillota bacterium]|nr:DUF438 domain-containing protein [Bacillota bacterium]